MKSNEATPQKTVKTRAQSAGRKVQTTEVKPFTNLNQISLEEKLKLKKSAIETISNKLNLDILDVKCSDIIRYKTNFFDNTLETAGLHLISKETSRKSIIDNIQEAIQEIKPEDIDLKNQVDSFIKKISNKTLNRYLQDLGSQALTEDETSAFGLISKDARDFSGKKELFGDKNINSTIANSTYQDYRIFNNWLNFVRETCLSTFPTKLWTDEFQLEETKKILITAIRDKAFQALEKMSKEKQIDEVNQEILKDYSNSTPDELSIGKAHFNRVVSSLQRQHDLKLIQDQLNYLEKIPEGYRDSFQEENFPDYIANRASKPFITFNGIVVFSMTEEQRKILAEIDKNFKEKRGAIVNINLEVGKGKTYMCDLLEIIYGKKYNEQRLTTKNSKQQLPIPINTTEAQAVAYRLEELNQNEGSDFYIKGLNYTYKEAEPIYIHSLSLSDIYDLEKDSLLNKVSKIKEQGTRDNGSDARQLIIIDEFEHLDQEQKKKLRLHLLSENYQVILVSATPNTKALEEDLRFYQYENPEIDPADQRIEIENKRAEIKIFKDAEKKFEQQIIDNSCIKLKAPLSTKNLRIIDLLIEDVGKVNLGEKVQWLLPDIKPDQIELLMNDIKIQKKIATETGIRRFLSKDAKGENIYWTLKGESKELKLSKNYEDFINSDEPVLMIYSSAKSVGGDFGDYSRNVGRQIIYSVNNCSTSQLQQWTARNRKNNMNDLGDCQRILRIGGSAYKDNEDFVKTITFEEKKHKDLDSLHRARTRIKQYIEKALGSTLIKEQQKEVFRIIRGIDTTVDKKVDLIKNRLGIADFSNAPIVAAIDLYGECITNLTSVRDSKNNKMGSKLDKLLNDNDQAMHNLRKEEFRRAFSQLYAKNLQSNESIKIIDSSIQTKKQEIEKIGKKIESLKEKREEDENTVGAYLKSIDEKEQQDTADLIANLAIRKSLLDTSQEKFSALREKYDKRKNLSKPLTDQLKSERSEKLKLEQENLDAKQEIDKKIIETIEAEEFAQIKLLEQQLKQQIQQKEFLAKYIEAEESRGRELLITDQSETGLRILELSKTKIEALQKIINLEEKLASEKQKSEGLESKLLEKDRALQQTEANSASMKQNFQILESELEARSVIIQEELEARLGIVEKRAEEKTGFFQRLFFGKTKSDLEKTEQEGRIDLQQSELEEEKKLNADLEKHKAWVIARAGDAAKISEKARQLLETDETQARSSLEELGSEKIELISQLFDDGLGKSKVLGSTKAQLEQAKSELKIAQEKNFLLEQEKASLESESRQQIEKLEQEKSSSDSAKESEKLTLETELEQVKSNLQESAQANILLQENKEQLEEQAQKQQEQIAKLEAEKLAQEENELKGKQEELAKFEQEKKGLEQKLEQLQQEKNQTEAQLTDQITQLTSQIQVKDTELEQIKNNLEQEKQRASELETNLATLGTEQQTRKTEIEEITKAKAVESGTYFAALTKKDQEIADLKEQILKQAIDNNSTKVDLGILQEGNARLKAEKLAQAEQIKAQEEELFKTKQEKIALEAQLETENLGRNLEIEVKQKELEELKNSLEREQKAKKEADESITELRDQLKVQAGTLAQKDTELDQTKLNLENAEQRANQEEQEKTGLQLRLFGIENEIRQQEDLNSDLIAKAESDKATLEESQKKLLETTTELEEANGRINKLNEENSGLKKITGKLETRPLSLSPRATGASQLSKEGEIAKQVMRNVLKTMKEKYCQGLSDNALKQEIELFVEIMRDNEDTPFSRIKEQYSKLTQSISDKISQEKYEDLKKHYNELYKNKDGEQEKKVILGLLVNRFTTISGLTGRAYYDTAKAYDGSSRIDTTGVSVPQNYRSSDLIKKLPGNFSLSDESGKSLAR